MGETLSRANPPSQSAQRRPPMNQAVSRASYSENMSRTGVLRSFGLLYVSVTQVMLTWDFLPPQRADSPIGRMSAQGHVISKGHWTQDISSNNVKERRRSFCYLCLLRNDGSNEELGENRWYCYKRNWKFMNHEIEMQPDGNSIQCGSPWEDRSRMRCGPKQCIWYALTFYRCFFLLPSLATLLAFKILKNLGPMILSLSSVLIWIWQK